MVPVRPPTGLTRLPMLQSVIQPSPSLSTPLVSPPLIRFNGPEPVKVVVPRLGSCPMTRTLLKGSLGIDQ